MGLREHRQRRGDATGSDNFFKPPPSLQGQPIDFTPGIAHNVFQTSFDLSVLETSTWVLLGLAATASLDSRSCFTLSGAPEQRAGASVIGAPVVGGRLALDAGVFAGDVGRVDIEWQRDESAGADNWVDIPGADGPSYVPGAGDAGHRIRAQIVARSVGNVMRGASNLDGAPLTVTDPTAAVGAGPTAGTPSITGTPARRPARPGRPTRSPPPTSAAGCGSWSRRPARASRPPRRPRPTPSSTRLRRLRRRAR